MLSAIEGLLRRFETHFQCPLLYGLPVVLFDLSILFYHAGQACRRRWCFPSYSWLGWVGEPYWFEENVGSDKLSQWLSEHTWISWEVLDGEDAPSLLWTVVEDDIGKPVLGYHYRKDFPSDLIGETDTTQTQASHGRLPEARVRPYQLLRFWTLCVKLYVNASRRDVDVTGDSSWRRDIEDRNWRRCGSLLMDTMYALSTADPVEFLVLSERQLFALDAQQLHVERTFWVMLVEWDDDVAERRGIGYITLNAIMEACHPGPGWKEITLG